jgi:hypothetical protein
MFSLHLIKKHAIKGIMNQIHFYAEFNLSGADGQRSQQMTMKQKKKTVLI